MKSPIRFQSRLLIRRSFKPERVTRRRLGIAFQPTRPVAVLISKSRNEERPDRTTLGEITLSG
jgi:hypothetical protein